MKPTARDEARFQRWLKKQMPLLREAHRTALHQIAARKAQLEEHQRTIREQLRLKSEREAIYGGSGYWWHETAKVEQFRKARAKAKRG